MIETRTTLLDEALPSYDFRSRHSLRIAAEPAAVWRAMERYDLRRDASLPVRALVRLRGLPLPGGRLREILGEARFTVLAERPASEIVAGTTGKFWKARELANMEAPANAEAFRAFERPGWAKAAIGFRLDRVDGGSTNLVTETRVRCVDTRARRRFAAYWGLIRFFSGLIRVDLLRAIARTAERER